MPFNFQSIETSLGSLVEENEDLEKLMKWEQGKIKNKIGIERRYLSNNEENTESLAKSSLSKLAAVNDLDNVGLLISVTNTPNNLFPSLSHYLNSFLNLEKNIQCIGINAGCSGFTDALIIAESFMIKNKCDAIIVTADTYSKYISPKNHSIRPLFSDGSAAILLGYMDIGFFIDKSIASSEPNTEEFLIGKKDTNTKKEEILMNGPKVLLYALNKVLPNITHILNENKVDIMFAHQAGKIVLDGIIKKISKEVYLPTNYDRFGNLVSSSIPFLLKDNFNKLNNYNNILLSGFGVGLSQSHVLLKR
jgi:3-oxoacyl-[acyl-carrier-protein] synthase-3